MNKKLPSVYAVPIEKTLHNNKEVFKSTEEGTRESRVDRKEIQEIFKSKTHVYKTRVKITTRNEIKEVDVVGETQNALLTLSGETIPLDVIIDIKKV